MSVKIQKVICGLCLAGATLTGSAQSLYLSPNTVQNIQVGDSVSYDLIFEGAPPYLSAFDITLAYNPLVLSISSGDVTFGTGLNSGLEGFVNTEDPLELIEVSLENFAYLTANQGAGGFVLANLVFEGIHAGSTPISFSSFNLTFEQAGGVLTDVDMAEFVRLYGPSALSGGRVEVGDDGKVPDGGGTLGFLALALLGLPLFRRR